MNDPWILFHLAEASEELSALASRIQDGSLDGDPDLGNSVATILGHLIAAWNGRNNGALRPDTISELSDEQFTQLRTVLEDLRPL